MARKPNLFVIGAMKSGTSSLCHYLSQHPAVFMSPVKEPMHFSREENWSRGAEDYLRLFQGASNERYLAEGSTEYTKRPYREDVAQRIHEFNPDARLIYVMRDPFARLVSQYRHQIGKGRERGSLLQAIERSSDYLYNGHYAYQLEPYLALFDRRAIYLDTFESLSAAPAEFCARLFAWLEIDASFVPPGIGKRLNVSPEAMEAFDESSLRVRFSRYLLRHTRLAERVPAFARRWYRALLPKESARDPDSEEFRREMSEARRTVRPLLAQWITELEAMTGRTYPEWPSRRGTGPEGAAPSLGAQGALGGARSA